MLFVVQLLIGTLRGNGCSGHLELCDSTAAIPVVVCAPRGQKNLRQSETGLLEVGLATTVAVKDFTVFVERTVDCKGSENAQFSYYLHCHDVRKLNVQNKSATDVTTPKTKCLYVLIVNKNALRLQARPNKCVFTSQALVHESLERLQDDPSSTGEEEGKMMKFKDSPVNVALNFESGSWFSYLHNGRVYRLSSTAELTLPTLKTLREEPCIIVKEEDMSLECVVELPVSLSPALEVGDLVSRQFLPQVKTLFCQPSEACRLESLCVIFVVH